MSDWWTYRLSDFLLFSPDTYRRLFELYNAEIWPAQIAAALLGLLALALALRQPPREAAAFAILAICWAWVGWTFHLGQYQTINWAAIWFAGAFGVQALLLAWAALANLGEAAADNDTGRRLRRGAGFSLCLLAVYGLPALDLLLGRPMAQAALFGVTPDPTAIATLGFLLMLRGGGRAVLWPIPLAWCAISGATLWAMNAPEAWLPPVAGVAALATRLIVARASVRRSRLAPEHGEER